MKSLRQMLGMMLLATSVVSTASEYHFKFNHQDRSQDLPEYRPEVIAAGTVMVNGVSVNAFDTRFVNPREGGQSYFRAKSFNVRIRAEHLRHVDAYAMPNGMILVPKDWRLVYGGIGYHDSLSYTFVPPHNGNGYITFYHSGKCIDCAVENGSLLFEKAAEEAKSRELMPYSSSNFPLHTTELKDDMLAYHTEFGHYRIDGVAYYNLNKAIPFWKVEACLPNMQDLANPLLNRFITLQR